MKLQETQIIRLPLASDVKCRFNTLMKARWTAPWANSEEKPAIYHCIARVVDKRFAFEADDKEKFRIYMRKITRDTNNQINLLRLMQNPVLTHL